MSDNEEVVVHDQDALDNLGETHAGLIEMLGYDPRTEQPPPLHEDLVPYVYEESSFGRVLKHPLVFKVPYFDTDAGMANRQYEYKLAELPKAREERNWFTYVMLHERAFRIDGFYDIVDDMTDDEYWETLSFIWTDTENIWQNHDEWEEALTADRPGRYEHFMDDDDRAVYDALPDRVEIWRGTNNPSDGAEHPDENGGGFSWTLDRTRGRWFAKRFASHRGAPLLIHGFVDKADVLAYHGGRNESEIVVLPEHVMIESMVDLTDEVDVVDEAHPKKATEKEKSDAD